jgi:hypothetical protein
MTVGLLAVVLVLLAGCDGGRPAGVDPDQVWAIATKAVPS